MKSPPLRAVSLLTILLVDSSALADPTVVAYQLVSSERVGRTTFDYTYRIQLRNDATARAGTTGYVTSLASGTEVLDDDVYAGFLEAHSEVSPSNTFTIRHDRVRPFDPGALGWRFESTPASVNANETTVESLAFVERRGRLLHDTFFEISGEPQVGPAILEVQLSRGASSLNVALVDDAGVVLSQVAATEVVVTDRRGDWYANIMVPSASFRVRLRGTDDSGNAIDQVSEQLFNPSALRVQFPASTAQADAGSTFAIPVRLSTTQDCGCRVVFSANDAAVQFSPAVWNVPLTAGQPVERTLNVTLPVFADSNWQVRLSAVITADQGSSNTALVTVSSD